MKIKLVEINEKIMAWARANPEEVPAEYLANPKLVAIFYASKHVSTKIEDCVDGSTAELTLLLARQHETNVVLICKNCRKAKCECQGSPDFEETHPAAFTGGEPGGGIIKVKFPPWFKGDKPVVGKIVVVCGEVKVSSRFGTEISVTKCTPFMRKEDVDRYDKAKNLAKEYFKIRDGVADIVKFNELLTKEGFGEYNKRIVEELKLKTLEGKYLFERESF